MRPVRSLLIYLLVVFVGGALLAPALYFLTQNAALHFTQLEKLARNPFHRFVNRSLLVLAIAGLWPLLRSLQIKSWRDLGLGFTPETRHQWRAGFLLGFLSLAVAALICILGGARQINFNHTSEEIIRHLFKATSAALVVAWLEEIVFRGALLGGLRRAVSWKTALLISSFIYAIVHFFSKPPPPDHVTWTTGFVVLGQMLRGFADFQTLCPALFNLTLAGIILGLAFQNTGALYLSIGLHAGWIFWLKSFGFFTQAGATSSFWGSGKLIDGWAAFLVLAILFIFLLKHRKTPANG